MTEGFKQTRCQTDKVAARCRVVWPSQSAARHLRSTARRSFRVELRGEWKRTAHSLPTTEIVHSQMRVCNREVGLSLFGLR